MVVILQKPVSLFRDSWREFFIDNCPQLSASVSFYSLFSLFPFTLVVSSITGYIIKSPSAQEKVIDSIMNFLPVSENFIASIIENVVNTRTTIGIVATVMLIWGGMSVFYSISKSLNAAWGIHQSRSFFHERLLDFCMMVGAGLLLLVSLSLTTIFKIASEMNHPVWAAMLMANISFWHCILFIINTALIFIVFLFLYKFIPNTLVRWKDIWAGALAGAICFEITKLVFVWFVPKFSNYNLVYGSLGALIALLTWIHISAIILLFCAKVTSVHSRQRSHLPST